MKNFFLYLFTTGVCTHGVHTHGGAPGGSKENTEGTRPREDFFSPSPSLSLSLSLCWLLASAGLLSHVHRVERHLREGPADRRRHRLRQLFRHPARLHHHSPETAAGELTVGATLGSKTGRPPTDLPCRHESLGVRKRTWIGQSDQRWINSILAHDNGTPH